MALVTIEDLTNGNEEPEDMEFLRSFSQRFHCWLHDRQRRQPPRAAGIHASEISCSRRVVYCLTKTEQRQEHDIDWLLRFEMGHAVHGMLQNLFKEMATESESRMTFEPEFKIDSTLGKYAEMWSIDSSCDGVMTFFDYDGKVTRRMVLEIKTKSDDSYDKLTAPEPQHIEQAHVYMACLDIPVAWFLYWNKNNQNYTQTSIEPFVVRFDEKLWHNLMERFDTIHHHALAGTLPDRRVSFECQLCPYKHTCNPSMGSRQSVRLPRSWSKP